MDCSILPCTMPTENDLSCAVLILSLRIKCGAKYALKNTIIEVLYAPYLINGGSLLAVFERANNIM